MIQIDRVFLLKVIKKVIFLAVLLFLIWVFFLTPSYILISDFPYLKLINFDKENVDKQVQFINTKYSTETFPIGNDLIIKELEIINQIEDPEKRLDEIFRWELHDWHNPNWERGSFFHENNSPLYISYQHNFSKMRAAPQYEVNLYGQRNPEGIFYGNDPYWISYNKVGACRELSNLFAFMAKKSGIESRTVQTIADHQWVEVRVNAEWKYYDPWCAVEHDYYNVTDGNLTFKEKWYNYRSRFRDNCHGLAYFNSYNDVFPNPLASLDYSISYFIQDINNFIT